MATHHSITFMTEESRIRRSYDAMPTILLQGSSDYMILHKLSGEILMAAETEMALKRRGGTRGIAASNQKDIDRPEI